MSHEERFDFDPEESAKKSEPYCSDRPDSDSEPWLEESSDEMNSDSDEEDGDSLGEITLSQPNPKRPNPGGAAAKPPLEPDYDTKGCTDKVAGDPKQDCAVVFPEPQAGPTIRKKAMDDKFGAARLGIMQLMEEMIRAPSYTLKGIVGHPRVYDYLYQQTKNILKNDKDTVSFNTEDIHQDALIQFMKIEKSTISDAPHLVRLFRRKVRQTHLNAIDWLKRDRRGGKERRKNQQPIHPENESKIPTPFRSGSHTKQRAIVEALNKLKAEDPIAYKVALLKHVEGRTVAEIAAILKLSESTINRKLKYIKRFFEYHFRL